MTEEAFTREQMERMGEHDFVRGVRYNTGAAGEAWSRHFRLAGTLEDDEIARQFDRLGKAAADVVGASVAIGSLLLTRDNDDGMSRNNIVPDALESIATALREVAERMRKEKPA